jgi:hypothetical protein
VHTQNLLAYRLQPLVERLAKICVCEACHCAPALCVPADNNTLNLEMRHSVLHNTRSVDIVSVYRIRDVAVHEDVARPAVAYFGLGDATVCAAYPENLWRLTLR